MARKNTAANMQEQRYEFKPAARIPKGVNAQACGERIESLRLKRGGHLEESVLVDDARDPKSPLHRVFEWDDTEAARQHRLEQARHLLRSITVIIVTPEEKVVEATAFVSTPTPRNPNRSTYTSTEYALSQPDLRKELLKAALRDLIAVRRKYAELSELAKVFAAIDEMQRKSA